MKQGKLARAAWAAAACGIVLGGARAHATTLPGAADRVLALVNQERARAGLTPLAMDPQLNASAQKFSEYMAAANFYAHNGPDGSTPLSRMHAAGFSGTGTWGENIAAYYSDAEAVMQVWMASPGHRTNILNPAFTHIGIGVAVNPNSQWKFYWTQDFGVRQGGGSAAGRPVGSVSQPQPQPQAQPPVLRSLSPSQGSVGDKVALIGQGFGAGGGAVSFSGTPARVLKWSESRVDVQVPAGASTGAVYLQNTTGTSNGVDFTVVTSAPTPTPAPATSKGPQAAYIYPNAGNPGTRVTIYGRGFGASAGQVMFNGVPGQVAYWYDTLIGVNVPSGASSGPVVVQTTGGAANPLSFTVNSGDPTATQPQLVYCSPAAGAVGTQVSVLGRNLGSSPGSVSFNGIAASVVNWTSSAVVVIVPDGATSGDVTAQTGGGTSNGVHFTVISPGQSQAASTPPSSPKPGPAGGSGAANGTPSLGVNAPTSPFAGLKHNSSTPPLPAPPPAPAPAPQPATTGGASGEFVGHSAGLSPSPAPAPRGGQPTIATMAPAAAAPGATITLQGSGFGSAPGWVRIGRGAGQVVSWSDTTVVARVPSGVGTSGAVPVWVVRRDRRHTQALSLKLTAS